jgi:hypothetical protein
MGVGTILPDGSAFFVASIRKKGFLRRWWHKLFLCPTFWGLEQSFTCPGCGKGYRCYWDGNDVEGHGQDYCDKCAKQLEEIGL